MSSQDALEKLEQARALIDDAKALAEGRRDADAVCYSV